MGANEVLREVWEEVRWARAKWPEFPSAHHGFAVLLEEVDELKAHVWRRDLSAMRKEAIEVAAMAVRFVVEVCDGGKGAGMR